MEHSNEATAYHEAGHAVVALALGRPVDRVTIVPDPKHAGLCEFRKGSFRPSDDWLEREILIALGGVAAEARHTGNYAWDSAARDDRFARSLAVQAPASAGRNGFSAVCLPRWNTCWPKRRIGAGGSHCRRAASLGHDHRPGRPAFL